MDDNDITELAKGMVPFVRECIAEATDDIARARRAGRPRGAHAARGAADRATQRSAAATPKVTRIERDADGNFVPVYDQPV